jgi:hypothetical protein
MAMIKKAQLGDHLVKRQSQDDRIHRIEKKNPERAKRVADRVEKRALRSVKPSPVKPPSKMSIPLRERAKAANAAKAPKAKAGKEMIKRADGSYSQRGLWDNIRAKKGSGKKPTAAMLKQEKKIKAKSK